MIVSKSKSEQNLSIPFISNCHYPTWSIIKYQTIWVTLKWVISQYGGLLVFLQQHNSAVSVFSAVNLTGTYPDLRWDPSHIGCISLWPHVHHLYFFPFSNWKLSQINIKNFEKDVVLSYKTSWSIFFNSTYLKRLREIVIWLNNRATAQLSPYNKSQSSLKHCLCCKSITNKTPNFKS